MDDEIGTDIEPISGENTTYSIMFSNQNGDQAGILKFDEGVFKFEGNAEESAQIFFEYLCKLWNRNPDS